MIKEFENFINNKVYDVLTKLITSNETSTDEKLYCIMLMIENKLLNADQGLEMAFYNCHVMPDKIHIDEYIRAFMSSHSHIGKLIKDELK